jgi:hypothetical protein
MVKTKTARLAALFVLCIALLPLLQLGASADVIWEPNDDFYHKNADKCEYVNRDYYTNGENGYMELFSEPGGRSLGFAENGVIFHVQFSYRQGSESWGLVIYGTDGDRLAPSFEGLDQTGWIRLSDTILKYDVQSFDEEHGKEFTPYTGDYSELQLDRPIVLWTFPNSGEAAGELEEIDGNFQIEKVYRDMDGKHWGYVGYFYGRRSFWVCLTDPANVHLPAVDVPIPEFHSPVPGFEPQPSRNDLTTVVIVCVAGVILLSAVLIRLLKRKQPVKNTEN